MILSNALKLLKFIRLHPYDTTTEEGRSNERMRRIALTALMSGLAKLISTLSVLIYIPLTLKYLGPDRYGIWMIFSSFALLFSFTDFGIGNGVLTLVAEGTGKADTLRQRTIITNGYISLCAIMIAFGLLFVASYQFIPWGGIFNTTSDELIQEIKVSAFIYALLFLVGIPIGLINRIQAGLQQSFESSIWQSISSLMGLVAILTTIFLQGGLPYLVASIAAVPVISNSFNTIWLFYKRRDLLPQLSLADMDIIYTIAKFGLMFFILQLNVGLTSGFDNIIISHFSGQSDVSVYAVSFQLFNMLGQFVMLALAPTWPAFTEALARGERSWVRTALKRALAFSFGIALVGSLALVLLMPVLQTYWMRNLIQIPLALTIGLMLWRIVDTTGNAMGIYLNAAMIVKPQIAVALVTGIMMIVTKILFVSYFGVAGMAFAAVITYFIFTLIPYGVIVRRSAFTGS